MHMLKASSLIHVAGTKSEEPGTAGLQITYTDDSQLPVANALLWVTDDPAEGLGCVLKMLVFCPPIVPVSNEGRKPA